MPVKKEETCCCHHGHGIKALGIALFLAGLLSYLNFSWDIVLMVVGAVLVLKGLWMKHKK
jgi:uncharacterized membrane protein HdeD (DUF308 family)